MSLRKLPELKVDRPSGPLQFEPHPSALARWTPSINGLADDDSAGDAPDSSVISILDIIGQDWYGGGVTARSVSRDLATIGDRPVTVNVNSPGGDFFEGLAIYNLLRQHRQQVTVNVLGLAASAAALITMAGDRVAIPKAAFLMIHNTWGIMLGDHRAMRDYAENLASFDSVIVGLLSDRSGLDGKKIGAMMDAETYIAGSDAVKMGFADAILEPDKVKEGASNRDDATIMARDRMERALAKAGLTRSARRELIQAFLADRPRAAGDDDDTLRAVDTSAVNAAFARLESAINNATVKG